MSDPQLEALPDLDLRVMERVIFTIRSTALALYPMPHFYARNVWPADYYPTLLEASRTAEYAPNEDGHYAHREFANPLSIPGLAGLTTHHFMRHMMMTFKAGVRARYADKSVNVVTDLRLVRDAPGYSIGPHTDAAWKLISLLFYLPEQWDEGTLEAEAGDMGLGTSIYVPRDPTVGCPGGPHYSFEPFIRVHTAPFEPNSCLGFWKTDTAFHGVEPAAAQRYVLLWNAYDADVPRTKSAEEPTNG